LGPAGTPYLGDVEKARYRKKTYTKEKWKDEKGRKSELKVTVTRIQIGKTT